MNRVSLTLGLAAMDTCWAFPWCVLLGMWTYSGATQPLLSVASIFCLELVAALTTQLLGHRVVHHRRGRFGLATLGAIVPAVAVRLFEYPDAGTSAWFAPLNFQLSAPVLAFGVGLYMWWRGVRIGSQTPGFSDTESAFRWGTGRLLAFGLAVVVATRPSLLPMVEAQTTPFVVCFFFVGLLTLALGRLESLRTRTRTLSINTQWFSVLVLIAALVVLLALLVAQLVSFDVLLVATRPLFDLLGEVLLLVTYAIVIPLAFVVQWLIYLILSVVQANASRRPPQSVQPAEVDNFLQRFFAEQVPPELLIALKAVGALMLLGLVLFIVARALKAWRPSSADADDTNEERDSLWSHDMLRTLLRAWLRRLLRRPVPAQTAGTSTTPVASATPQMPTIELVRQLYAQLLRLGEAAGAPRAVSATPLEHEPALSRALEPPDVVHALTEAYIEVRYADREIDGRALRSDLEHVRPKGAGD